MKTKMIYAPIYITTLCRDKHFIREMESLRNNSWACYTDVYVALDYPSKKEQWNGYNKILEYLSKSDFSSFATFSVFKREQNLGSSKNSKMMRDQILEKYDRWIYAEDDLEFSPNFIEYMDKCLMEFYDDEKILAVNGYSYPVEWHSHDRATVIKQGWTCSTWGIGHWKHKYTKFRKKIIDGYLHNIFDTVYRDGRLNNLIHGKYYDYITYALATPKNGLHVRPTDVAMGIYIGIDNMYVITPIISKVRNYGLDGSGENCKKMNIGHATHSCSYDYNQQPIDCKRNFSLRINEANGDMEQNKKLIDDFLYTPLLHRIRAQLMLICYRLIGQKKTCCLYQCLKLNYNKIKYFFHYICK